MKVYISNINEKEKYLKVLQSMTRGDFLYLLHEDDKDSIPLSVVNYLQQAKGTIQFIPYDHLNPDLNKAYIYGKLANQCGQIILCTDDDILLQVEQFNENAKKQKPEKTSPAKKEEIYREPEIQEEKTSKSSSSRMFSYKNESEYRRLKSLCGKLSTTDISLGDYIPQIVKAVEKAIADSESFSSSLMIYCKNDIAEQIDEAFIGYEPELFAIVENLNVED